MLDWLYDLNDIWVGVIFAGTALVLFFLSPLVGARLGWTAEHADRANYVLAAERNVLAFAGIILAFSLVQVTGNFKRTEEMVAKEASQLDTLDRQVASYGGPQSDDIRVLIRTYARSIVDQEWPALAAGHDSAQTEAAMNALSAAILSLSPAPGKQTDLHQPLLKTLDEVIEARHQRIIVAELRLLPDFWIAVVALLVIAMLLGLLVPPWSVHSVTIIAASCGIAVVAALVFCIDSPFRGYSSVAPTAFAKELAAMRSRN